MTSPSPPHLTGLLPSNTVPTSNPSPPQTAIAKPKPSQQPQTAIPKPKSPQQPQQNTKPKTSQPSANYVIRIPKDQIYRVPPPEKAHRYHHLSSKKPRRSCCCRCVCSFFVVLLLLLLLVAIAGGVFYLIFRPQSPKYFVDDVSIAGLNTTLNTLMSPEFNVTIAARNPNERISIYYEKPSSIDVYYENVFLCNSEFPAFHHPTDNVTVIETVLEGSGVKLPGDVSKGLVRAVTKEKVPFFVKIRVPVRIKIGFVQTWRITVKVDCEISVDKITEESNIISKQCDYGVTFW